MERSCALQNSTQSISPLDFKAVRTKSISQDRHFERPIEMITSHPPVAQHPINSTMNSGSFAELTMSKELLGGENWWKIWGRTGFNISREPTMNRSLIKNLDKKWWDAFFAEGNIRLQPL